MYLRLACISSNHQNAYDLLDSCYVAASRRRGKGDRLVPLCAVEMAEISVVTVAAARKIGCVDCRAHILAHPKSRRASFESDCNE
jgi:hypothetical protein